MHHFVICQSPIKIISYVHFVNFFYKVMRYYIITSQEQISHFQYSRLLSIIPDSNGCLIQTGSKSAVFYGSHGLDWHHVLRMSLPSSAQVHKSHWQCRSLKNSQNLTNQIWYRVMSCKHISDAFGNIWVENGTCHLYFYFESLLHIQIWLLLFSKSCSQWSVCSLFCLFG